MDGGATYKIVKIMDDDEDNVESGGKDDKSLTSPGLRDVVASLEILVISTTVAKYLDLES